MKSPRRRALVQAVAATFAIASAGSSVAAGTSIKPSEMSGKRILIVVSSHDRKGQDMVAGFWFPELTHPAKVFSEAGYAYDIASPQGGMPPFDGFDLKDEGNSWFWIQPALRNKLANSLPLSKVDASKYAAVMLVGGHGPMWDFVKNNDLHNVVRRIYENGGIVSAVCHGPAGLLDLKLTNGSAFIEGKKLTAFTNEEEVSRQYDKLIPFQLETALKAQKAVFEEADIFKARVVIDDRLITGQNPASAKPFGEAVVAALKARSL
ncbi:type 1 glutamine amidotransferase domain-containing protein [Pigmentiphaga aceris]|uniref:Type 1 glutamine amidotransferase domain-containing protein n=1 Tax=Pigmentiphaga aceris TaxID=1940612 RepID=A0A5C0B0R1_9BURK|nr:type 1 glutamine amidotransferase domain-containing protein [Pigmentiphaga aceris]QEI06700.1 type 1 glutamine amidotransferase domain-containing protein [Pigmentiphaga aceris]